MFRFPNEFRPRLHFFCIRLELRHDTSVIRSSIIRGLRWLSGYSDLLLARRSGVQILVEARFSAPIQTGCGAHPASYKMGTGSLFRG